MVSASVGGAPVQVPLYEGRASSSGANLFVLAVPTGSRGATVALLGSAAASVAPDGLVSPELVLGWGDTAAGARAARPDARAVRGRPEGSAGPPLPDDELQALHETDDLGAGSSLLARGLMAADAVAVPSPAAAAALSRSSEFSARASDQPLAVVRLGCDEPPNDPHSDPALVQPFSADNQAGKAENRKALGRSLALSLGQRSLLCVTPPLEGPGGATLLSALGQLAGLEVVVVVRAGPDRALNERAKVLAIENPGKIALHTAARDSVDRELLAAADAALFLDAEDLTGRSAGLALRYGALPIAPDSGAFGSFLVDYDPTSATGTALLYAPGDAFELVGAMRRGLALRTDGPSWTAMISALMRSAPRWSTAAAILDSLVETQTAPHVAAVDASTPTVPTP
jgi:glycogen synthase